MTTNTLFQDSHLPLMVWFRAMWLVTNQKTGISALGLQRALGLGSYHSAWACLNKLRRAMVRPGREPLSGQVEVDETYVGGHEKGSGGRRIGKKALVAIAVESNGTGCGRVRLRRIKNAEEANVVGFVRSVVAPGATVATDGHWPYRNLEVYGYRHQMKIIRPSHRSESSKMLPRVHRVAALLKRWLLGVHQGRISRDRLNVYLDEFTFRFNRRLSPNRGMLFQRLVQQAVAIGAKHA